MSFVPLPFIRMLGSTPGSVSGESVELTPYWPKPGLYNGQSAVLEMRVEAAGSISGNLVVRSFVQRFSFWRDQSGISHLSGSDSQHQFGAAAGVSWTVAMSVGVSPDRLSVIFTTGSTTVAANVTADVYYTVEAPPATVPSPVVEWRSDFGATTTGTNSPPSTWYSRQPANTFELVSTSIHIVETPSWQNGLPGIGYTADYDNGSPPNYNPPTQAYPSNLPAPPNQDIPLTGNSLTVYMVLDYGTPGATGPFEIFNIGIQNDDSNVHPQFKVFINPQGGSGENQAEFEILDQDPSTSNVGEYFTEFVYAPTSAAAFSPSLLVVQTQRNSGQNCIFQGRTLSSWNSETFGTTIPNFQSLAYNRQVVEIAGFSYIISGVNFAWEAVTRFGHVLIYNAYHTTAQIQAVSESLNAFWGL